MKKFFLHIGTHKTGTTSIQNSMSKLKNNLRDENIIYIPVFPEMFEYVLSEKIDISLIEKSKKIIDSHTNLYLKSKDITYVMSNEGFSGDPRKGYYNASINAEMLSKVLEPYDVEVVIYLRRQDSFLESMYTQTIHEGGSLSFNEFVADCDQYKYDWYNLIDSYANYFGKDNITVKRYDKSYLKNGEMVDDFADHIGSSVLQSLNKNKLANSGYSRDALELARICNEQFTDKEKKKLRYLLQSTNSKLPHEMYSYFNIDAREELLNTYANSNDKVVKEYLGDNVEKLFDYDLKSFRENDIYGGLSQDAIIRVMMKLLVSLEDEDNKSVVMNKIKKLLKEKMLFLLRKIKII